IVVVVKPGAPLRPLVHRLAGVPGVARVARVQRGPRGSAIDLTPAVSPFTDAGRAVVDRIRALPGHGPQFLVTGETAGELDFLALTRLGYIESTMPVVIVCTLFGVSMDYEVFMLSRIAEAYRAGASNRDAVATGLVATGRIITSAASILVVVGLAFTTADVV